MSGLVILPLLFLAMWWFTIRPQQQRLRAQRALVASIQVNDVVLTAGGVVGRIVSFGPDDEELMLDVGRGTPVEMRIVRAAVTRRISPDPVADPASPVED